MPAAQAWRTLRYSSTLKILAPSLLSQKGKGWTTFTPPAAAPCRRFRGLISHCRSHVVVVDPQSLPDRLADSRIGKVLENQIRGADAVFLSRGDIADTAMLRRAALLVAQINPLANHYKTIDAKFMQALEEPHDNQSVSAVVPDHYHQRLFVRRTVTLEPPPDRQRLITVVAQHAKSIHRLKGYLNLRGLEGAHLLQLAGGVQTLEPASLSDGMILNQLVVISPDPGAVTRLAEALEQTVSPKGH